MILTSYRFQQLKAGAKPVDEAEQRAFEQTLAWKRRSDAAKRAVQTKRRKYKKWPTRKRDHL